MDMYKMIAEVNQFGVIRMTKAFLPEIRKSKGERAYTSKPRHIFTLLILVLSGLAVNLCKKTLDPDQAQHNVS